MEFDIVTVVLMVMLGISEGIAEIPVIKSNSVFQLVLSTLKFLVESVKKK